MKELDNLIGDIYRVLSEGKEPDESKLEQLGKNVVDIVRARVKAPLQEREPTLRLSQIGKPARQVYFDLTKADREPLPPQTLIKFMYGDLIEELVLYLAAEAGYEVSNQQKEVDLEGVKGHIDCTINDIPIDVKSASKFAFKKFKENAIHSDDPFGYMKQLGSYTLSLEAPWGGFLAMNKESGELALAKYSKDELEMEMPRETIQSHREMLEKGEMPEPCYKPIPDGKSGNMKIALGCSYCSFKAKCWPNARKFIYSNGPTWLTTVKREPKVFEDKEWTKKPTS